MDEPPKPANKSPEPAVPEAPPKPLTHEEQMAQFEEDLKETDWGHQPC